MHQFSPRTISIGKFCPPSKTVIEVEPALTLKEAVNEFKRNYITKVLEKVGWKQTKASDILKIQRTYLSRLINELNISKM